MLRRTRILERAASVFFLACGTAIVGIALVITAYSYCRHPCYRPRRPGELLLFSATWTPSAERFGILPFILTSVGGGTAGALMLVIPVGVLTALYLSKMTPKPVASIMRSRVELLAGIPSVIYGLVGMILIVPALQHLFNLSSGSCLLATILVLSVMVLPYIISVSFTALNAVPPQYEHASLALGASPVETYVKVSLRAASSGVFASIIQGTGRALGSAQLAEQVLYNLIDNAIQR